MIRVIVGLGNPGPQYAANRHNIGMMAVQAIAHRHRFAPAVKKFHGRLHEGRIGTQKLWLLEPETFMNRSGIAVAELCNFYKILPEEVLVIHDELALAPGRVRLKQGGGNGGHNGLKSVDAHLGKDYWRMRLGIGHPGHKDAVTGYVLGNFMKDDQKWLESLLDATAQHLTAELDTDPNGFLNKIALAMTPFWSDNTPTPKTTKPSSETN